MRRRLRPLTGPLLALLLALAPLRAAEAQLATLIADSIGFNGADEVEAAGNVEIYYNGNRILAERLIYNRADDALTILGPITLIEENGQVVTASYAELSGDLKDGIMQGARLVLEEQMQIAAAEINRVDGRYNQLYKAVASSCRICANGGAPLWRIRAERVIHDQEARQLYFDNAVFEIGGLPVFYLPRMRLPDPSLRRSSGFLIPSLKQTTALGFGFRFPYFLTLGDHADVTLTPFVTSKSKTVEGRYRQAFRWGRIQFSGAVSVDDILPDETRAYLFGQGRFNLPYDFKLDLNIELVSDRGYLDTYDYSDKDRLSNGLSISRTRRHEYIFASAETLRTLRDSEVPVEETLATELVRGTYERRFPRIAGGEGRLTFDVQGYERNADSVTPALQAACTAASVPAGDCLARDVFRTSAELGWHRDWLLAGGALLKADTALAGDFYVVGQDPALDPRLGRITPAAAVELRWPLMRTAPNGARDVIQPVMQLAWSESYGDTVPVEDGRLVDFDMGNLLSLSRFPGHDARETGLRATAGLTWTHVTPKGHEYALAAARVFRTEDPGVFGGASGLDGRNSDWLLAGRVEIGDRLSLTNRSLFDTDLDFTKAETRLTWRGEKITAATSYIWVDAAPVEGRFEDVAEWNVDFAYDFNRNWTGSMDWRYDFDADRAAKAGIGVEYRNECVNVGLSLSRTFTTSTSVEPSTDIGLTVSLNGFGRDGRPYARGCKYVKG